MKVRALRGVCIGVERHMKPSDVEDLEPALGNYLISIGAAERVVDEPVPVPAAAPEPEATEPAEQPD